MVLYYTCLALVVVTGVIVRRIYVRSTRLTAWQDKPLIDRLQHKRVLNQVKWVRNPVP